MKIETTPRDDHQVRIVAEFEPEFLEKFKRQAARKISQEARIPGFRPGKAPYDVVRRSYGEDAIEKQAIELMLDEVYPQVLKEAAIEPAATGSLEEIISTNPPIFAFIIPLMPKTTLGDYSSIRADYLPPVVSEEQVDQYLKNMRTNYSTAEPVDDRPVQEGDLVSVKISGAFTQPAEIDESKAVDEAEKVAETEPDEIAVAIKENTVQMIVGENDYEDDDWPYEGFTRELIGVSVNDAKTVNYTFAPDYDDEKLRGREVAINATVLSIKHLNMPEINDSFAQTLGEYSTVEELRSSIHKNLQENEQREYDNTYFGELIDQIIGMSEINYPPQVLQDEIDRMLHSLEHDLEDRKMDMPTYLKTLGKEQAEFIKDDLTPVARHRLERSLVLDTIAQAENVRLDTQELQKEVAATLQIYQSNPEVRKLKGQQIQNFMQNLTMETATRMVNRAVMDRIKTIAMGQAVTAAEPVAEEAEPQVNPAEETPTEEKPADE